MSPLIFKGGGSATSRSDGDLRAGGRDLSGSPSGAYGIKVATGVWRSITVRAVPRLTSRRYSLRCAFRSAIRTAFMTLR